MATREIRKIFPTISLNGGRRPFLRIHLRCYPQAAVPFGPHGLRAALRLLFPEVATRRAQAPAEDTCLPDRKRHLDSLLRLPRIFA